MDVGKLREFVNKYTALGTTVSYDLRAFRDKDHDITVLFKYSNDTGSAWGWKHRISKYEFDYIYDQDVIYDYVGRIIAELLKTIMRKSSG